MSIKMVVTDLDGTLLRNDKTISDEAWKSFHILGEKKIIRVAATGRNMFSLRKVIPSDFPFDFIVFSTGSPCCHFITNFKLGHFRNIYIAAEIEIPFFFQFRIFF